MIETQKTIDYKWLVHPTGDPFADVGGYTIKCLSDKFPEKDILELIEYMAEIYVDKWGAGINTFFLNSAITQPAFKGQKKIDKTMEYFRSLIDERAPDETGFCRISGRNTKLFKSGRDNSLMTGSGTFVNFHHNFQSGMMFSKEILIRLFFIPFGSVSLGGKIAIIHSNEDEVNEYFVQQNCRENMNNLGNGCSESILKSQFGIPSNSLFHFVDNLLTYKIKEATDNWKDIMLTLYHFSNFGASPEMNIYRLPANVFRFYITCNNIKLRADWQRFLRGHYSNTKFRNAKYNETTSRYEIAKKEETEQISFEDYKIWRNSVLDKLLENKPLIKTFLAWVRTHNYLNFTILEKYQKEIQNMKQQTLDKIKELAAFLTNADSDTIKKTIKALDGYKSAYELRRFFVKNIVAKNYKEGNDIIISVNDMVYYLFPDDISWRDIRDILLVAIYEELHINKKEVDADLLDEIYEETENINNN